VGLLAAAELWRRSAAGATPLARVVSAAGLAAAGAALAFVLVPGLRDALSYAGGWFTGDEAFLGRIRELRPILFLEERFDASAALDELTPAVVVFPLAWAWLGARCVRGPGLRADLALLLAWSAVLFALTLAQERFANLFALGLALTLGAALEELHGVAKRRLGPRARLALAAAFALALAATLVPALRVFERQLAASRVARSQPGGKALGSRGVVLEEAARWLRDASPPTRGFLDAAERPEYGVLTAWSDGHLVRYRAERPTVEDSFAFFGDRRAFELAGRYYDTQEEEVAYAAAQQLGARYAFATPAGSGQTLVPSPRSIGQRMWRLLGSAGPDAPALARHRLVWIRALPGGTREPRTNLVDRVAVFEIVPGALVEGEAAPGALVRAELVVASQLGRIRYRAEAQAAAGGRYALRLPYATDRAAGEVGATGPYRLSSGDRSAPLAVREADVRAGATVGGPSLR
jgi:hypothetical protein